MFTNNIVPISFSNSGGASGTLITLADVISNITNKSNWNNNGDYTGVTTGLTEGNYYFDDSLTQKYEFLSGKLRRYTFNQLIG